MSLSKLLEDYFGLKARDVQLGLIGKVQKFDKAKMRADVQPLMKLKNELGQEVDYPVLADIPVLLVYGGGFYIRPVYEVNDLVWIGFSTFDIDQSLNGYARAESEKTFSLENACVINGVPKNNFSAPSKFNSESGLIMGHKDGNSTMIIESDKIIFSFGTEEITLSQAGIETKTGQIKAGGEVSANNSTMATKLSTHIHPYTDDGVPSNTSPPTAGT